MISLLWLTIQRSWGWRHKAHWTNWTGWELPLVLTLIFIDESCWDCWNVHVDSLQNDHEISLSVKFWTCKVCAKDSDWKTKIGERVWIRMQPIWTGLGMNNTFWTNWSVMMNLQFSSQTCETWMNPDRFQTGESLACSFTKEVNADRFLLHKG